VDCIEMVWSDLRSFLSTIQTAWNILIIWHLELRIYSTGRHPSIISI
jgi:DNA-binding HxlR family transcriptional regulator